MWVCSRFVHLGRVEYTDNAQVRQHIVPENSRLQGFIKKIYFEEYAPVHKGDTLLLIEDAEFRLRLAQAEADYQNALAGRGAMGAAVSTAHNNLAVSDAGIEEAEVLLKNAEKDYERYRKLLSEEAVTQQQYDGCPVFAGTARQLGRQLREGRAAYPGAHRLLGGKFAREYGPAAGRTERGV
mgnify:CR=1 FL=1